MTVIANIKGLEFIVSFFIFSATQVKSNGEKRANAKFRDN